MLSVILKTYKSVVKGQKGSGVMKKRLLSLLVAVCMIIAYFPLTSTTADAASLVIPQITSLTSSNGTVTVKWSKAGNPGGTQTGIHYEYSAGRFLEYTSESACSYDISGLPAGAKVKVYLEACSDYYGATYNPNNYQTITVQGTGSKPKCPRISSLTSANNSVTVNWDATNNPSGMMVEVINCTYNTRIAVPESKRRCTLTGLTEGDTITVIIRAYTSTGSYVASNFSEEKQITVEGPSTNTSNTSSTNNTSSTTYDVEKIKLNQWYCGTTLEEPGYFTVKTTGRTDSKYQFFVRTTYAKVDWFETDIEMVNTEKTLGRAYYYDSDSTVYAPLQSLKPNTTYKFKVYGKGSALFYERDVDYEFMVKEVIAKPAKGEVTLWKGGKKKATLKFAELAKATRYQVAYKKKGGSYKYCYTTSTTKTLKNLSKNEYYYVKVRGQRKVDGKYYSGAWSEVKKTKIK